LPAYYKNSLDKFIADSNHAILGILISNYANDGYYQLLGTQSKSWEVSLPMIRKVLVRILEEFPKSKNWGVLLEYPLYRLRKRIDLVLVSDCQIFVVEFKVGAREADTAGLRQVEEYALDLRDFHGASHNLPLVPILCCTEILKEVPFKSSFDQVKPVCIISKERLADAIIKISSQKITGSIDWQQWEQASYKPVPTIIEAATTIFAGHNVKEISRSDADNLLTCSKEIVRLITETKEQGKKRIIVVTGVPGAGKTLAGLNVIHSIEEEGWEAGKVVYLSGNTPLLLVIREALAQDEKRRSEQQGKKRTLEDIRRELRSQIQHIIDFLKEYYLHDLGKPSFENAIVFDEAQRAWDHKQGLKKFSRDASEPELLIKIMDRHINWAAIVCLVGAGQEINAGEPGMQQWGDALTKFPDWELITPTNAVKGLEGTAGTALFPKAIPENIKIHKNDALQLIVPLRSYRSERVSEWVEAVLDNRPDDAKRISKELGNYPITLVRSIRECRKILKQSARGTRRCGLLASAGASRLIAEGLGVALTVQDKNKIAHWYLKPHGDYRSSNSLEITANEYTSQGLEVDFAGVCWGGDLAREAGQSGWKFRRLHKTKWQNVHNHDLRRYILNKYRVFLTRAREGLVLFVPYGDSADSTRVPGTYEAIADYLITCGVNV